MDPGRFLAFLRRGASNSSSELESFLLSEKKSKLFSELLVVPLLDEGSDEPGPPFFFFFFFFFFLSLFFSFLLLLDFKVRVNNLAKAFIGFSSLSFFSFRPPSLTARACFTSCPCGALNIPALVSSNAFIAADRFGLPLLFLFFVLSFFFNFFFSIIVPVFNPSREEAESTGTTDWSEDSSCSLL